MPAKNQKPTVLVAGFFDLLHSGHVKFLERAAELGELTVVIGSDENSLVNKHKIPIYSQEERRYMVSALRCVKHVVVPDDTTSLNFAQTLIEMKPDSFVINEDGDRPEKRSLCEAHGAQYVVLKREPHSGLPPQSTTALRKIDQIPHRLDLSGFFDQRIVNSVLPGSVVILPIECLPLQDRSGMSSSTRNQIRRIFGNSLPCHLSSEELARLLFAVENPPGSKYISGTVDALGLVVRGVNKFDYRDDFWPCQIRRIDDDQTLSWLESILFLQQTRPRPDGFELFTGREDYSPAAVGRLRDAADHVWSAIERRDTHGLAAAINEVHAAQHGIFPGYVSGEVRPILDRTRQEHLAVKLAGAGGYGYMIVVSENPPPDALRITARRSEAHVS
jgi:cytidyltransferase-like protein